MACPPARSPSACCSSGSSPWTSSAPRVGGLVRALSDDGFLVLLGSVLTVAALGTAAGAARTGMRPLVGAQPSWPWARPWWPSAHLAHGRSERRRYGRDRRRHGRPRRRGAPAGPRWPRSRPPWSSGAWWLTLVGQGIERISETPTLTGVWIDLGGWPLLAAAALAAAPVLLRSLPLVVRVSGAAVAVTLRHLVAAFAAADESALTLVLVGLAVVAGGAALSLVTAGEWRWLPVVPTAAAGLGLAAQATYLGGQALETFLNHGLWEVDARAPTCSRRAWRRTGRCCCRYRSRPCWWPARCWRGPSSTCPCTRPRRPPAPPWPSPSRWSPACTTCRSGRRSPSRPACSASWRSSPCPSGAACPAPSSASVPRCWPPWCSRPRWPTTG